MKKSLLLFSLFVAANSITIPTQAGIKETAKKYTRPALALAIGTSFVAFAVFLHLTKVDPIFKKAYKVLEGINKNNYETRVALFNIICESTFYPDLIVMTSATAGATAISFGIYDIQEIKADQNQ